MSSKKERIDIEIIEHLETYYKINIGTIEVWIQESDLEIAKKDVLEDKKSEEAYREKIAKERADREKMYTWDEVEAATKKVLDDYQNGWY